MKEAHCGQLHPHRPRSKLKMVTLHGEQPSNKNININISYNLTEKGGRVLDSANEPEWIGSGANTPTSHGRIDCLGRKVTQHDVLVTENANRSPHATIRKGKEPSAQPQDIVSNECEISIRVVNKQRQRKPAPLTPAGKGRSKLHNTINIEVNERQHVGAYSNPCSPSKYRLPPSKFDTVRKPKPNKIVQRRLTEKTAMPTQKTQAYAKTEQQELKPKTTAGSKELSNRQQLLSGKQRTPPPDFKKPLPPQPMDKNGSNRINQRPQSTKSHRQTSSKKRAVAAEPLPLNLERKLLRRIVRVSQLSYSNQSEADQLDTEEQVRRSTEQERMHYAADTIKLYWQQYRRNRVLAFYESVFRKNARRQEYECGVRTRVEPTEFLDTQSIAVESYVAESEELGLEERRSLNQQQPPVHKMAMGRLELLKHRQSSSGNIEEEDSQFDINKYHKICCDLQDEIVETRTDKVQVIDLKSFRQHQIQQWSGLKELIRKQLQEGQEGQEEGSKELLHRLIQQTEQNKRWIESGVKPSKSQEIEKQPLMMENSQHAVSSNANYRELVEEKGIADKAFADLSQVKKRVLENEESIIKSKRSNHKSSLSDNSMGSHHRRHSSDDVDTFKEGRGSLTSQLLLESQSKQQQSTDQADNKVESINSYLDCGLNQFEFKDRLTDSNEQSSFAEPPKQFTESDDLEPPQRERLLEQLEEHQPEPLGNNLQDRQSYVLQQITEFLLLEFCQELYRVPKMETNFKRSFLNVPAIRPHEIRPSLPGIRCNPQAVRQYLTGFIHFVLRNSHYAMEVVRNLNFVLGPSSREILFYLRADSDQNELDFVEEEGYIFAIPLSTFESYELSLPLNTTDERGLELAMMSHHWHRAIFETLNETLDAERPYGILGKPYLWSQSSRVSRKKIFVFRSAVNRMLEMLNLPCGIMFDQPDCPYYGAMLLPEESQRINEDRISLMLADELFENEPNLTCYDDETTEVLLEMAHYLTDKLLFDAAIELCKLRRVRSFME